MIKMKHGLIALKKYDSKVFFIYIYIFFLLLAEAAVTCTDRSATECEDSGEWGHN